MVRSYMLTKGIKKTAFEINISPSGLIGAATGAFIAKSKVESDTAKQLKDMLSKNQQPVGYYQQVDNLANNVHIVFTPLGVLYVLKEGASELVVDQVSVSDMNAQVMDRFRAQDRDFFKNVMLNKVKSDIDLAERAFANRMISRKMAMGFDKGASCISEHFDEMKELIEKVADSAAMQFIIDEEDIVIHASFTEDMDINKVANTFGQPLEFPNFKEQEKITRSLQGKMDEPEYLAKKSAVEFLPDRVLFIVDKLVVGQLSVLDMNEEGFLAFQSNDKKYFYDFFAEALGVDSGGGGIMGLFKKASLISDVAEVFYKPMVHPEFYFLILTEKMGREWIEYDPEVLIKEIEEDFELTQPMHELVMNKILMIQVANNPSALIFKNIRAFEKAIRTMNDKPIDFGEDESNISLGEFVFGLRVLQNVTPFDDIYDNFSEGVVDYIVDTLVAENYRLVYPRAISESEKTFFDIVDKVVRHDIVEFIFQDEPEERIKKEHTDEALIAAQSRHLVNLIRESGTVPEDIRGFVAAHWDVLKPLALTVGEELDVLTAISVNNIVNNLAVDAFIDFRDNQLKEIRTKFLV